MFEHHHSPVISRVAFLWRMARLFALAAFFTGVSLGLGMLGYRYFEALPWVDCFLNAAMLLGGMGEIDPLRTEGGKIFAGIYALYSGLWVMTSMGLLVAPIFHRILHHFHHNRANG